MKDTGDIRYSINGRESVHNKACHPPQETIRLEKQGKKHP